MSPRHRGREPPYFRALQSQWPPTKVVDAYREPQLFNALGAPIAHEDHALRASYTALALQTAMQTYSEDVRRRHGVTLRLRVGLNAGEVVVRAIGNDLHMDYSAVGQTVHLAARMEQLAPPGSVLLTAATLRFFAYPPVGVYFSNACAEWSESLFSNYLIYRCFKNRARIAT